MWAKAFTLSLREPQTDTPLSPFDGVLTVNLRTKSTGPVRFPPRGGGGWGLADNLVAYNPSLLLHIPAHPSQGRE